MGANDPQIQMAEDAASALMPGANVESVVPSAKVEIADSLAPFLIVFDKSGKVLASSASFHGAVPAYPAGVLDYVPQKGQDRVTWQPEAGVRMATVVGPIRNGFVMAGRSLTEVEKRESQVESLSGLAMLVYLGRDIDRHRPGRTGRTPKKRLMVYSGKEGTSGCLISLTVTQAARSPPSSQF